MAFIGVGILVISIMITYLLINIPIEKICDFPLSLTQDFQSYLENDMTHDFKPQSHSLTHFNFQYCFSINILIVQVQR